MTVAAVIVLSLAFVPSAAAVPPTLISVGSQALHPTATFSAPKSDHVVIEIATRPDRASDGEFLTGFLSADDSERERKVKEWRRQWKQELETERCATPKSLPEEEPCSFVPTDQDPPCSWAPPPWSLAAP